MLFSNLIFLHVCQEAIAGQVRTHARIFRTHLTRAPLPPPPCKFNICRGICHPPPLEFLNPTLFDTGPAPTPFVA